MRCDLHPTRQAFLAVPKCHECSEAELDVAVRRGMAAAQRDEHEHYPRDLDHALYELATESMSPDEVGALVGHVLWTEQKAIGPFSSRLIDRIIESCRGKSCPFCGLLVSEDPELNACPKDHCPTCGARPGEGHWPECRDDAGGIPGAAAERLGESSP